MYVIRDTRSGYYFRLCSDLGYDYWTTVLSNAKTFTYEEAMKFIRECFSNRGGLIPEKL